MLKTCSRCLRKQPIDNFYLHKTYGHRRGQCKECIYQLTKAWRNKNKEFHLSNGRKTQKARAMRLRETVLSHYSKGVPKCVCCGVTDNVFLTLDHTKKNGAAHREQISGVVGKGKSIGSVRVYSWVVKNKFPKGFQVLCFNCNYASFRGVCPHRVFKVC